MKHTIAGAAVGCILAVAGVQANAATPTTDRQKYSVYVDESGVLRRTDTKAEVSYYGTNYTVPFAHAYRALGELGVDRKEAIRRDVYHFARLGLNAFRLHLWDVEITDSLGNLQANDHLDLLDFLIAELESRGIDIVLTAQTNFGNGYPDKDIDTGGYSYDFDKCDIHSNPRAQEIQENYLTQLVSHVNPYTGLSYGQDRAIIAMEVNNEPCHTASPQEVTSYINRMVKAMRHGGFDKPVLYNVSHNPQVVQGYYDADIQGTTYQWYPTGLVSGHQRHGNFLPHVDKYHIPWADSVRNYDKMARFIYEFDPGDVLNSNLYPAIVRTLRGQGFQWVTQFAYDPIDMARFNTEYQTHFLNLAYTPSKAISMLIAAKAMQEVPRGAYYGAYPENCDFGNTQVKHFGDMSIYNSPTEFYSSSYTMQMPECADSLEHLAGVGSNALVDYMGTGAWFLDKLDSTHWRLEVMPDVLLTQDPFAQTSLDREVGQIIYAEHEMGIDLPALGEGFTYKALNVGNQRSGKADGTVINAYPGVYLLSADGSDDAQWDSDSQYVGITLGEYAAPTPSHGKSYLTHTPYWRHKSEKNSYALFATLATAADNPEVTMYPVYDRVNSGNPVKYKLDRYINPYQWYALIEEDPLPERLQYRITVRIGEEEITYPGAISGNPTDAGFPADAPFYSSETFADIPLIQPSLPEVTIDCATASGTQHIWLQTINPKSEAEACYQLNFTPECDDDTAIIRADHSQHLYTDISPDDNYMEKDIHDPYLRLVLNEKPQGVDTICIGVEDDLGVSYMTEIRAENLRLRSDGLYEVTAKMQALTPDATWLLPVAYPWFTPRRYDGTAHAADPSTDDFAISAAVITLPHLKAGVPVSLSLRALQIH